jgi:hypothetical protein
LGGIEQNRAKADGSGTVDRVFLEARQIGLQRDLGRRNPGGECDGQCECAELFFHVISFLISGGSWVVVLVIHLWTEFSLEVNHSFAFLSI